MRNQVTFAVICLVIISILATGCETTSKRSPGIGASIGKAEHGGAKNYIEGHFEYVKKRKWIDTSQKEKVFVEERIEGDRRVEAHYENRLVPSGYWEEYEEKIWVPSHYE